MREAFKEMARKSGVTVKDRYWALGSHDVIAFVKRLTTKPRPRYPRGNAPLRDITRVLL